MPACHCNTRVSLYSIKRDKPRCRRTFDNITQRKQGKPNSRCFFLSWLLRHLLLYNRQQIYSNNNAQVSFVFFFQYFYELLPNDLSCLPLLQAQASTILPIALFVLYQTFRSFESYETPYRVVPGMFKYTAVETDKIISLLSTCCLLSDVVCLLYLVHMSWTIICTHV